MRNRQTRNPPKITNDFTKHPAAMAGGVSSFQHAFQIASIQERRILRRKVASVPSLTDDSQIGAHLRVCADEENRADCDQHGRSRTIGAAAPGPKHAAEGGLESTDRAAG